MLNRWFSLKTVHSQVVALLLVFIIIPTAIISTFMISKFSEMVEQNAIATLETALEHSKENTKHFMKSVEDTALMIMTNQIFVDRVLRYGGNASVQANLDGASILGKYLFEINLHRVRAKEIAVFKPNGDKIFSGKNTFSNAQYSDERWYKQIDKLDGLPYWGSFEANGDKHIYVARKIKEYNKPTDRFELIGIVLIVFSEKEFAKINASVNLANSSRFLIMNREGKVVSVSDPTWHGSMLSLQENMDHGPFIHRLGDEGDEYLGVKAPLPNSEWSVVVTAPLKEVLKVKQESNLYLILVTGICIVAAFILASIFAYRMTRPLKLLAREVKHRFKVGDFSFKPIPLSGKQDEITELGKGFYRLLSYFNDIKNTMHKVELMKKEAELDAMKSKINPHFLYNSLESIRMLAVINKDFSTAEMIKSLGQMFRYIISGHRDEITLREELIYLQSYINLQKLRYEDQISVEVQVPERLLDSKILKLILQPLVENSIAHGIDKKRSSGHIRITAEENQAGVLLRIWDDGAGITPKQLDILRKNMHDPENSGEHIGLKNVHQRLRLFFGQPYGLTLESVEGEYTTITVTIPNGDRMNPQS